MPALRISVGFVVNPLIIGFAAISFMPARSAPSANSLTFRFLTSLTGFPLDWLLVQQDMLRRFGQRFYRNVRFFGPFFRIRIVDEERLALRRLRRPHVAPAIAHQETCGKIDAQRSEE